MATFGVFQHWGLGDLVMTIPVLVELRRLHPDARIVLMVRGRAQADLLKNSRLVDEIRVVPPNAARADLLRFFLSLRRERFDAVFVATRITPAVPLLLRLLSGVRTVIGDGARFGFLYTHRNSLDPSVHRVDRMLETLALWTGKPAAPPVFQLPISEAARSSAEARLKAAGLGDARYFAFHPGSSGGAGRDKRLPVALVTGVVEALSAFDPTLRFAVIFGPDDLDLISKFTPVPPNVGLIHGCSLDETKVVLSRAVGFLGSDSSLGHIASAYGVPSVTAAGPTNPDETRPWGPLARIVRSREDLSCRPCWFTPLQGKCPFELRCMTGITPRQVMDEITPWLRPGNPQREDVRPA